MNELVGKIIERLRDCGGTREQALYHILAYLDENEILPMADNLYEFHKAFRQRDITGNGHLDMAVWNLLATSHRFWEYADEVSTAPAPSDAAGE